LHDCFKDSHVPRAAAEVATQSVADLQISWGGRSLQEIRGCENHSRRADAALRSAAFEKRLLDCVKFIAVRDSLDRSDFRAFGVHCGDKTAIHEFAIHHDRTRATLAFTTAFLCARQLKIATQGVEQPLHWKRAKRYVLSIDGASDGNFPGGIRHGPPPKLP
jgi:hypothetical protein